MWIDDAGLEHRESWYCNRVIVKDLQTQQIYYFPFYNWLGTKNGDGETERLSRVNYKRRILDESDEYAHAWPDYDVVWDVHWWRKSIKG
uniref:PLAT domain-containing protein n=1 Tax=Caenorhabditis japonica TaxID=281687 RepID=A0A8R1EVY5_CAEJA